jgi:hypothetical protein
MKKIFEFIRTFLKNTGEKIQATHPFAQIVSFCVCAGLLMLILVSTLFHPWTDRSLFYFPEATQKGISAEIRYIPHASGADARLEQYVSELLLGPGTPGVLPLYSRNTFVRDAYVRKGAAYIDLSADALSPVSTPVPQEKAYALFKKNVCTNFRNVDKIYLYIDGIEVYSGVPDVGGNK